MIKEMNGVTLLFSETGTEGGLLAEATHLRGRRRRTMAFSGCRVNFMVKFKLIARAIL